MVRQKSGKYLVLFKGGGHKMSPRFHLFVSNVNQGNEGCPLLSNILWKPYQKFHWATFNIFHSI